jgi:hypothetical protein
MVAYDKMAETLEVIDMQRLPARVSEEAKQGQAVGD